MYSLYKKTIALLICFLVLAIPKANAALYGDIRTVVSASLVKRIT